MNDADHELQIEITTQLQKLLDRDLTNRVVNVSDFFGKWSHELTQIFKRSIVVLTHYAKGVTLIVAYAVPIYEAPVPS